MTAEAVRAPAAPRAPGAAAVTVASAAVLLASMDTYVIVLALPAMMGDLGLSLDRLQEATPIVSGFLLGYIVVMPVLGRLSDLQGRRQALLLCMGVFAAGSLVTASAHDLGSAVAGRALQGLGGGGLVPVTLALVADRWPAGQRSVPLGAVGAVQELGSVLGPLYGALLLGVAGWRAIFWLNLPLTALLVIGVIATLRRARARVDFPGAALALPAVAAGTLAVVAPAPLLDSVTFGTLYVPIGGIQWLSPLALAAVGFAAAWALRAAVRSTGAGRARAMALLRGLDVPGAACAAVALGAVVLAFASADPAAGALPAAAPVAFSVCGAAIVLFALRELTARTPLVPLRDVGTAGAAGALLVNLAAGAALMAALLDVPILARATVAPDSQLGAAVVLLRLLVGVPIGALLGGVLSRRVGNRLTGAAGLALAAGMFAVMWRWTAGTLGAPLGAPWLHPSDPVLLLCGAGFGLAIAPVNASMLAGARASAHGVAAALIVVARMVGMVVGVAVITALGLHAFHVTASRLPSAITLCPQSPLHCAAYDSLVTGAIVDEVRTVFLAAAACAALAAVLAALLLRTAPIRTAHA